ncbi:hypothetical protein HPB49_008613 [Dermacentor silvarum]|uniref:Uncharacterized protein n=1 Tax=Dermacentor silvarum TaxID=543639 RepID=A0ACB8DXD0_DERSI|nr:hypothetical protein HPB49_008613 [Dermacentor silvarum]
MTPYCQNHNQRSCPSSVTTRTPAKRGQLGAGVLSTAAFIRHLASAQTVVGFGSILDWRPTIFVNAFPSTRMCSACGLVPPATAMLPCHHLLCALCYKRGDNGIGHCPLDKEMFLEEDVIWSTHISRDTFMNRSLHCQKAHNGCNAEGAASVMVEHYTDDCPFHAVSCPRCNGKVLHLEIINHLESRRPPPTSPSLQARDENIVNATLDVKNSLRSVSENCKSLETKVESFEERLANYRDDSVAALARMIATRL